MLNLRKIFITLAILACAQAAMAYKLIAKVVDSEGEPQAFATYTISELSDSTKVVTAGTAGPDGDISTNLNRAGKFIIKLSYVGAADRTLTFHSGDLASQQSVDLGTIIMEPAASTLGEVEVVAQKPLVTKDIDRVGYDVQADREAPTSTLSEMLRKVPMVSVDADGTITINGSSNFQIYKNGRPSKGYSNNAKEIFKAIPASMIKRIEVITEPGARYDAEGVGAILNIVTLEDVEVKGVTGNAGVGFSSKNLIPAPNIWLNSQINKVAFSLYAGYHNFNRKEQKNSSLTRYEYSNGNVNESFNDAQSQGNMTYFGAEASYDLDSLNLFTAEVNGYYYGFSSDANGWQRMIDPAGATLYSYNTANRVPLTSYLNVDASANYQHLMRHQGEMLNVGYQLSTTRNNTESNTAYEDMYNMPVGYTGVDMKSRQRFIEHTLQVDWTRPFAQRHTIEIGAKGIIRLNRSLDRYGYIGKDVNNVDFHHTTDVAALYAQYSIRLGKVNLRAGLRYEYSYLKADDKKHSDSYSRKLNDLVPSAAASWQVNDANSLTFNYASRINRPGIDYLNPTRNESPNSLSFGNQYLNSAMFHSLKLTYMLIKPKFNCNLSVNYDLSNNGIADVQYIQDNRIVSTYENIGHRRALNFSGFMQWTITSKISFLANGSIGMVRYSQMGMELKRWNPFFYVQYSHQLPWKLNGQLGMFMFVVEPQSVYSYTSMGRFSNRAMWRVSLSRSFLKEDRLNVRVEAINPIGRSSRNFTTYTVNGDYGGCNISTNTGMKQVRLAISYRFGSMGSVVKKTSRKVSNDDIVGGSSAPGGGNQGSGGM